MIFNNRKSYKASFTVETTYVHVFIFFSIVLLIYLTLSIYNVSILTSKAYYILEECVAEEKNEDLQSMLYEKAYEVAKYSSVLSKTVKTNTKTEFNQISIDYDFTMNVPVFEDTLNLFQEKKWEYGISANCNRERLNESLFLLKGISEGIDLAKDEVLDD